MRWVLAVIWRAAAAIVACPVPAVTPVHEDMHKRTRQEEQPRQEWHDMRPMFGHEEIAGDRQKAEQDEVRARGEEAA